MKLGAQLYTVRKQMQTPDEIKAGLEKIAKIGYSCVQVSGIGKVDPKELKKKEAVSPFPTKHGETEKVRTKDIIILTSVFLATTAICCMLLNYLVL